MIPATPSKSLIETLPGSSRVYSEVEKAVQRMLNGFFLASESSGRLSAVAVT
ncbi:MAG: hypothetical protein KA451_10755 [Methyloversatilis sp.]|jgi:hypothetical protein|nr:hypothetical protein [Methyloversatilis sp.]